MAPFWGAISKNYNNKKFCPIFFSLFFGNFFKNFLFKKTIK